MKSNTEGPSANLQPVPLFSTSDKTDNLMDEEE